MSCWPCASSRLANPAARPHLARRAALRARRAAVPCEPLLRIPASESALCVEPLREAALRTRCASRLPQRPTAARFRRSAFTGGRPWQYSRAMRSRAAIRGNLLASCIPEGASDGKSAPPWQHIAAMHPKRAGFGKIRESCIRKAPQTAFRECIARRSCQGGALFAARTPQIIHDVRISLGSPPSMHRSLKPSIVRRSCHPLAIFAFRWRGALP